LRIEYDHWTNSQMWITNWTWKTQSSKHYWIERILPYIPTFTLNLFHQIDFLQIAGNMFFPPYLLKFFTLYPYNKEKPPWLKVQW
jgi:hypothetical protein